MTNALIQPIVQRQYVVQYNGTNSAQLVNLTDSAYHPSVVSESGGVLVLANDAVGTLTVNSGDFILFQGNAATFTCTAAQLPGSYYTAEELAPPVVNALGIASIPSIGAGGNATVNVTLTPTLADTSYTAVASIVGSTTVLGQLSLNNGGAATPVSGSIATVSVHNGALVTVTAGQLLVTAVHN